MTKKEAMDVAGVLSRPSKMPGYGYGLPALVSCNVGRKIARSKHSVCHECYALKGRYVFLQTILAQTKRLNSLFHPLWVKAMIKLIGGRKKTKYFRWHDSGDLISFLHLTNICEIAKALPDFQFWLPTQEHKLIATYLQSNDFPDNLTVRLSTPRVDHTPVNTTLCTSSTHKNSSPIGYECPAPRQNNSCGDCRACWDRSIKNVSYKFH